jgi:hypothetical protein
MNTGDLIQKYVELRDHLGTMEDAHKKATKPYKEAMETIEGALLAAMNQAGLASLKGDFGTAFKKTSMSVKTVDKEVLMDYVRQSDNFGMLTAAVSKDAVKAYLEENNDTPPPGVDVTFHTEVQVRRAS